MLKLITRKTAMKLWFVRYANLRKDTTTTIAGAEPRCGPVNVRSLAYSCAEWCSNDLALGQLRPIRLAFWGHQSEPLCEDFLGQLLLALGDPSRLQSNYHTQSDQDKNEFSSDSNPLRHILNVDGTIQCDKKIVIMTSSSKLNYHQTK